MGVDEVGGRGLRGTSVGPRTVVWLHQVSKAERRCPTLKFLLPLLICEQYS